MTTSRKEKKNLNKKNIIFPKHIIILLTSVANINCFIKEFVSFINCRKTSGTYWGILWETES